MASDAGPTTSIAACWWVTVASHFSRGLSVSICSIPGLEFHPREQKGRTGTSRSPALLTPLHMRGDPAFPSWGMPPGCPLQLETHEVTASQQQQIRGFQRFPPTGPPEFIPLVPPSPHPGLSYPSSPTPTPPSSSRPRPPEAHAPPAERVFIKVQLWPETSVRWLRRQIAK